MSETGQQNGKNHHAAPVPDAGTRHLTDEQIGEQRTGERLEGAACRDGGVLPLTEPGRCRDWVHVDDVVEACVRAASADDLPAGTVLNLGTGRQTANEELVAVAERVTGRRIRTQVGAHPGRGWDTGSWVSDPSRARELLDWTAATDLETGLRRTWAAGP